jgi:N-acetylmuramoyl-L-alanine amidase
MSAGRKNFNRIFARVSPVFVMLAVPLLCTVLVSSVFAEVTASVKRQAAQTQFAKAEEQRALLNGKPEDKRTLADYKQVVTSYRRVYLITPHANEVPNSLLAVAELYAEMGDRFGRSYYQSAVDSYLFLAHEYPKSKFCEEAYLRAAHLQKDQLGERAQARKNYEEFLNKYKKSPRRREAQEGLAELALLESSEDPAPAANPKTETAVESAPAPVRALPNTPESAPRTSVPRVRRISTSASADSTRITLDLEDTVQYSSARIKHPDRIFFDLHTARLTPEVAKGNIAVDGKLLTAVRVAQNKSGVVRVVLDVTGVKDYDSSLVNNPPRLVIDLYATTAALRAAKTKRAKEKADSDEDTAVASAKPPADSHVVQTVAAKDAAVDPKGFPVQSAGKTETSTVNPSAENSSAAVAPKADPGSRNPRSKSLRTSNTKAAGTGKPAAAGKPDLIQPATAAPPTRDGQSTLTRALGLKIGRIVIDPGHGGHDTGTIGPTGLMEKDLCLDVALRLGKIIAQRLPGADVVYTRSDDTFIPLEDRTNIANQAKADLFISIHANSSRNHDARGIETYYLNLKGSPDAMEVAARENASSQESVHDLEDLVKKIARNEKIDESREFAEDIQDSLAQRIQKSARSVRNRGVRKAPFVVLIGADMPSILTEISFLSNPADEKMLKKPEYRQRVAEGLYQGVASYLQSLNSMTVNLPGKTAPARTTSIASVEQSRNQQ